jgi:hypothetical protein
MEAGFRRVIDRLNLRSTEWLTVKAQNATKKDLRLPWEAVEYASIQWNT